MQNKDYYRVLVIYKPHREKSRERKKVYTMTDKYDAERLVAFAKTIGWFAVATHEALPEMDSYGEAVEELEGLIAEYARK